MSKKTIITHRIFWGVLFVTLIATFFRLYDLGTAALRADTICLWNICSSDMSPTQIFSNWMQLVGGGQFPFPAAIMKGFLDLFHLPVTHFTVRLPSALWGIACTPLAFLVGKKLKGNGLGFFLAIMFAVNPTHIQVTREAYYYPPALVGALLVFLGLLGTFQTAFHGERRSLWDYVANLSGFGLLVYSQPTAWGVAFLSGVMVIGLEVWTAWRTKRFRSVIILIPGYILLGLPMLFANWGLKQFPYLYSKTAEEKALQEAQQLFAATQIHDNALDMLSQVATSFAWGQNTWRIALLIIMALFSLFVLVHEVSKRRWRYLIAPFMLIGGFSIYIYSRGKAAANFEPRYTIALMPFYFAFLGLSVSIIFDWLKKRCRAHSIGLRLVPWIFLVLFALPNLAPAFWATQITGKPTPYKEILSWFNTHLRKDTLVLVDRWFEPWNELAVYASTNVSFTFTIPDEPLDTFIKYRWRDTAQQFFERFPDAAYLELTKHYWTDPSVGRWEWPRNYFARHVVFTNQPGIKLRELGLASRGDFYAPMTNGLIVEVFYNTTEDVLQKYIKEGKDTVLLYGSGWEYAKLWRQLNDFRDWRVLSDQAVIEIYNLTGAPLTRTIKMRGMAAGASKTVADASGKRLTFQNGTLTELNLGPVSLAPGKNEIVLKDPIWTATHTLAFVDQITLE